MDLQEDVTSLIRVIRQLANEIERMEKEMILMRNCQNCQRYDTVWETCDIDEQGCVPPTRYNWKLKEDKK